MKTLTKGIEVKKALEIAKPFVGSLRKKFDSRPVLKSALVNEEYVIATDSHCLIRIKHNENVTPYVHSFKGHEYEVRQYPETSRLIPDKGNVTLSFKVNIAEWLEAHELALIAAKEHKKNKNTRLEGNKILVNYSGETPNFNDINFSYSLATSTEVESVTYNCEYMLMILKAFKKLKEKEVTCYFYGPMRPMYFVGEDAEILILPVRAVN